jgi:hypothetical protein
VESRTGVQIVAACRLVGDAQSLVDRHTAADMLSRVNVSIRSLRGFLTANGLPYFMTSTSAATLASTQVSGETYSSVPFPPTATQILGVDVESSAGVGDWKALRPITWAQRRNTRGLAGYTSVPEEFAIISLPFGTGASVTAGAIALFPAASTGQYKIWFLPDFIDLTDNDVFLGLPDWHEWVVQDVVEILSERDDDAQNTYAIANRRKLECEARILDAVPRVTAAGPLRPRRGGGRGRCHR